MAEIITFHVDAKGFYIHSFIYESTCINSIWLNRVEGRSSVGWGFMAKIITFHVRMQRAFAFIQVRISGGRQEECGVGGRGGIMERFCIGGTTTTTTTTYYYYYYCYYYYYYYPNHQLLLLEMFLVLVSRVWLPNQRFWLPNQQFWLPSQRVLVTESAVLVTESAVLVTESALLVTESQLPNQTVWLPNQTSTLTMPLFQEMINRKQRCVRDGAVASLLENERCQDITNSFPLTLIVAPKSQSLTTTVGHPATGGLWLIVQFFGWKKKRNEHVHRFKV